MTNSTFENFANTTDDIWITPDFKVTPSKVMIALALTAVVIVTSFGNLVVLLAFLVDAKLRQPFNLYILNLAITDFLVAVTAMFFYSIDTLLEYWPFGQVMCGMWIYFDFAMTFASVFTLVAISLDRFWCVTWANHYRLNNSAKKTVVCLCIVWLSVFIIWTPPFIADRAANTEVHYCIWEPSKNRQFVLFVAVVGHYIPCLIMVICYFKVFIVMRRKAKRTRAINVNPTTSNNTLTGLTGRAVNENSLSVGLVSQDNAESNSFNVNSQRKQKKSGIRQAFTVSTISGGKEGTSADGIAFRSAQPRESSQNRDKKIFITLTYVMGSYLICWFPFYVIFDTCAWQPELIPSWMYYLFFWTSYFNSTLNPFIYAYTSRDFRKSFMHVIRCFYTCKVKQ